MLQAAVGPLLDAQLVRVDAVPEELRVPRRRRTHHRVGVEVVGHGCGTGASCIAGLNFMMRHIISATSSSPTCQVIFCVMKKPSPSAVRFGPDDVGQLGRDADLLAGPQVPVVGLLAVGRDDADIACVVEQSEDLAQRVVVGPDAAEAHHRPHLDHRRRGDDAWMARRLRRVARRRRWGSCRPSRRASGRPSAG